MTTQDKKYPALSDTDPMPVGEFKGQPMQDVPAKRLKWYYEQDWCKIKYPSLWNYIYNSKEAIEQELGYKI